MQFIDLKIQYARLKPAIEDRFAEVMRHGVFIMGPEINELEERLAQICGAKHAISCASGTDALLMPLLAWGIGPGDAVFTTPFTFYATAEVVALVGATPIFVDIDPHTYNICPKALEKAIEAVKKQDAGIYPLPKAALEQKLTPRLIIPVDIFGQAAEYDAILPIATQQGLKVMEDAAQSFGGTYRGKPLCGLACEVATTSFFPAKPLGCYGDGGAMFTDDDELANVLRSLRVHGKGSDKYDNLRVGINGRMDTLQAALMLPKLDIFTEEIAARQKVAAFYSEQLGKIEGITVPYVEPYNTSAWAQYTIQCANSSRRNALAAHLKSKGIPTAVYYPKPLHMQSVFTHLDYKAADLPVAAELCQHVLSLPMHPYLTEEEQARVCEAIRTAGGNY